MKNCIKLFVLSLFTIILISGCSSSFNNKSNDAKAYLKEKYGINKTVKDWHCISYDDTLNNCSNNSIYIFDDGIEVYYDANKKEFQDNYQNEKIINDAEVFFNNFLTSIGATLTKGNNTYKVTFNTNMKGKSYFHEKYDGNIEEYALKGGLIPKLSAGFVITSRGDYKRLVNLTKEYFDKYFKTNYVNLFYITNNLYNQDIFPNTNNEDCFAKGLLHFPQYTRPEVIDGLEVPKILMSGDHAKIRNWRLKQCLGRTYERRPDLLEHRELDKLEKKLLQEYLEEHGLN